MYRAGELIIYGKTGICRITEIAMLSLPGGGKERQYYILKPLYQEGVIYTPVDNDKVFMRPIISKAEAERLIAAIPSLKADAFYSTKLSQLAEHYDEMIRTYDCANLIEITMSIYAKKRAAARQKLKFGAVDERFLRLGEEMLFGELAAALGITRDEVPAYIERTVNAAETREESRCEYS